MEIHLSLFEDLKLSWFLLILQIMQHSALVTSTWGVTIWSIIVRFDAGELVVAEGVGVLVAAPETEVIMKLQDEEVELEAALEAEAEGELDTVWEHCRKKRDDNPFFALLHNFMFSLCLPPLTKKQAKISPRIN